MNKIINPLNKNYISPRKSGYTDDYDLFTTAEGNRDILEPHVLKLNDSMQKFSNISSITCIPIEKPTGKAIYEIIDGQHRFKACVGMKLPIEFDIWDIKKDTMIPLNENSKNWSLYDYLNYGIANGIEDYIELKRYIEETGFTLTTLIELFGPKDLPGYIKGRANLFKKLEWRIEDKERGENILNLVQEFNRVYSVRHYNHIRFVLAFKDVYNSPQYNHEVMMYQMSQCSQKLTAQASKADYIKNFEVVYNHNKTKKITFPIKNVVIGKGKSE